MSHTCDRLAAMLTVLQDRQFPQSLIEVEATARQSVRMRVKIPVSGFDNDLGVSTKIRTLSSVM